MSKARDGRHSGWRSYDVEPTDNGMAATVLVRGEWQRVKVTWDEIQESMFDGESYCTGECECTVEPDGVCSNGWPSALLVLGLI